MGIYSIQCEGCMENFDWFSGSKHQLCPKCVEEKAKIVPDHANNNGMIQPVKFQDPIMTILRALDLIFGKLEKIENKLNEKPLAPGEGQINDPAQVAELNRIEEDFGPQMTEEELAKHFGEKPPEHKQGTDFKKMKTLEEVEDWEKEQDNSHDIYKIAARVKNLARGSGGTLTPQGEMLANTYVHVLKALYDFADTIPDRDTKTKLVEILRKNEGMPASLIEAAKVGVRANK